MGYCDRRYFEEIDIARGLAIIGVVAIHSSSAYLVQFYDNSVLILNTLVRYSVPVFILMAGFLHESVFEKEGERLSAYYENIRKRFRRLIVPYLLFSIVYMLVRIILENTPGFNSLVAIKYDSVERVLSGIFLVKGNPAGHLYFLPLLFFIDGVFPVIGGLVRSKKLLLLICSLISIVSYTLWGGVYSSVNPLKGVGFYALGYFLRESLFYEKMSMGRYTFVILMSFCICIMGHIFSETTGVVKAGVLYGMHVFGALFALQVAMKVKRIKSLLIIRSTLVLLGRHSFDIYLLHEPYVVTGIVVILIKLSFVYTLMNQVLSVVLGVGIPLLFSWTWLRKLGIYCRYFLGLRYMVAPERLVGKEGAVVL